jgi:hypothetical protein
MNLILNVEPVCGNGHTLLRGTGRPWLIHAECANSDCDRATAQWPDAEERAGVVLGSLESPSGSGSYIRHSDQTNYSDHKTGILLVSSLFKDVIPTAETIQQRIKRPDGKACIVIERKLRNGDILTVARKCKKQKRPRSAHDRDYPSNVRTWYLKVLYCVVSCIVIERLWLFSLSNCVYWKAG